ncbi:MAG: hypothetical protein R3E55_04020 [Burkholderiaceae bacterium]
MLGYSDLEPAMRERFLAVVREEVGAMGQRITDLVQRATQRLKTRWPMEDTALTWRPLPSARSQPTAPVP